MKKFCLAILILTVLVILPSTVRAQGGAKQAPQVVRDADLENDSLHNLEVARHYFKLRKAYVAALQRCEEIVAGHPTFSRIDEVLLIAGQSSLYLADGKGKQKPALYVVHEGEAKRTLKAEEFRELARDYFSHLVNDYPESAFRAQAEIELKALGGAKPKQ
jgi:outer membrane protein assembly factor BamD (BamD/ComL family)